MTRALVTFLALLAIGLAGRPDAGAAATSAASARDRCVRGTWTMSNAASSAFLQRLIGQPNFKVARGVLTAAFPREGSMRYGSTDIVVQFDAGGLVLSAPATFVFEASWSTANGRLSVGPGRNDLFIAKFSASKDGKTVTIDGPGGKTTPTPAGSTPYTCRGDTLRWKVPRENVWVTFRRAR